MFPLKRTKGQCSIPEKLLLNTYNLVVTPVVLFPLTHSPVRLPTNILSKPHKIVNVAPYTVSLESSFNKDYRSCLFVFLPGMRSAQKMHWQPLVVIACHSLPPHTALCTRLHRDSIQIGSAHKETTIYTWDDCLDNNSRGFLTGYDNTIDMWL